jgi:hypothetical protein
LVLGFQGSQGWLYPHSQSVGIQRLIFWLMKKEDKMFTEILPAWKIAKETIDNISLNLNTFLFNMPFLMKFSSPGFFFKFYSFIHMCIHCLGHFSPLLLSSTPPPVPDKSCSTLITNFVEENT